MTGQTDSAPLDAARRIIDDAWVELRCTTYIQRKLSVTPERLPDLSLKEAERRSAVGRSLLKRMAALDRDALPHDVALTIRLVQFRAQTWAREADWYWTVVDPLGIGMFGLFLPTAYCGGWFLNHVHSLLAAFSFTTSEDADHYLTLITDYARVIEQFGIRTAGQAARGMRMPKVQVTQARELLSRLKADLRSTLGVTPERIARLGCPDFLGELETRLVTCVEPAFDQVFVTLSGDYPQQAPEVVGIAQYAGGAEVYADLVKLHTTLNLTPEQVHARGHARMADIESKMLAIRNDLAFEGDNAAFLVQLDLDARWRESTVDGLRARFQRYSDRAQSRFADYFRSAPKATCCATPLPNALQDSMTFGYYDPPREGRAEGQYLFNASNLAKQALFCLGSIAYHELIPGHHLQFATLDENKTLHPFRKHCFVTANIEGWAEYAATLADEMGCYTEPEERYGRLVMDAFLTCRLVVDTGMNALGWSLEQAQEYMRRHTAMTETEILSDSIRYSCDIPAQGLAYKLGDAKILDLRELMHSALGTLFDVKQFHATVLDIGAVPLPDLEWHVQHVIDSRRVSSGPH